MIEFAVVVAREDIGRWVLAVDPVGERLLIAKEDQSLRWVPMADCKFLKAANPDVPRPVVVLQATPKLAVPSLQINGQRQGRS